MCSLPIISRTLSPSPHILSVSSHTSPITSYIFPIPSHTLPHHLPYFRLRPHILSYHPTIAHTLSLSYPLHTLISSYTSPVTSHIFPHYLTYPPSHHLIYHPITSHNRPSPSPHITSPPSAQVFSLHTSGTPPTLIRHSNDTNHVKAFPFTVRDRDAKFMLLRSDMSLPKSQPGSRSV